MDIEDYYYDSKDQKGRKWAVEFHRRKNTWRKRVRMRKGAVDGVAKRIQTAGDWDADRINEFCEDVLQDGGLIDTDALSYSRAGYLLDDSEVSLKKEKRWLLCDEIRKAAMLHANDPEMPDVVIIERFGKTGLGRKVKPDITRAMYSITTPVAQPSKKGPNQTRLMVDRSPSYGKSYFFSEATLEDNIKKASDSSQDRAEVTYTFRTSDSLFLHPPDKMKRFYRKMPNARSSKCKEELDAYYNSELWDSDNEADSGHDDLDVEMEPRKELVVNLEDQIAAALSKNKRASKNRKVRKQTTPMERATKKGKVIRLPLSERTGDIGLHEDDIPTRHAIALKMPTETIREFITQHEITRSEGVSIANVAPASFTVDLRPAHSNNIKDGFCHLLFETDYDPDMFDSTDGDQCNVVVTMCSSADEIIMQTMFESLAGFLSTSPEDGAPNASIEQIISAAKFSVTELWNSQGNTYHKMEPDCADKKGTRNFHICEDLSKRIGARSSSYPTIDNLRHSTKSPESEPDEDYDFEVVPDISKPAEKCRLCHSFFGERENSGMAIRDCRHWFCKRCWSNHICQSEEFIGKCMEPGCTSSMNFAMKLILCSYKLHQSTQRLNSGRWHNEFAYLCPNSSCGKVVKTTFPVDEPSILTCSCGTAWCGQCGNEPHWPASCGAAEMQSLEYIAMSLKSSCTRYTKECSQCQKAIERGNVQRYPYVCPHCSYQFYCWKCVGRCINDFKAWYNQPCKREEVPETKILTLPGFCPDGNTPDKVYESIFKIMKSLRSYEFENKVRRKASSYFEGGRCEEMMPIVTDLLFARNQLCFFIVWITAAMRYGNLKNSSKRKYIQGILKKLESARDAMDWLLISRDYACNDGAFPEAYKLNVTKANSLVNLVIHAFK